MTAPKDELELRLKKALRELTKLSEQIRASQDFSESSGLVLCLEEIVKEQMAGSILENSSHPTY
jgi:hypothetical protein